MRTLILVIFGWSLAIALIRAIAVSVSDYPRVVKYSRGSDTLSMLFEIGFAVWAAFLLWGGK